jgi:hypothetical protein
MDEVFFLCLEAAFAPVGATLAAGACGFAVILGLLIRRGAKRAGKRGPSPSRRSWSAAGLAALGGLSVFTGVCGLYHVREAPARAGQGRVAPPSGGKAIAWPRELAGGPAEDFTLPEARTGRGVRFSRYREGRPAVLVFGAFT